MMTILRDNSGFLLSVVAGFAGVELKGPFTSILLFGATFLSCWLINELKKRLWHN